MAIKPVLFNTEMVRAIQEGRKTVTRRICKGDRPPFERGDILWVRETWAFWPCITCGAPCVSNPQVGVVAQFGRRPDTLETADGLTDGCFLYRADGEAPVFSGGHIWRPAIHMPRQAARIFLRVRFAWRQYLQESINGVPVPMLELAKEGIPIYQECEECIDANGRPCCRDLESECGLLDQPRYEFSRLWDSTIPKNQIAEKGWAANPEVWVIGFERIKKPEGWPNI